MLNIFVNGIEFVRRAKRYAKRFGLPCHFDSSVGRGSHGRLYVGERFTTVPRKEIGKGLLQAMMKDLDINKEDF